jgi:hypothetical protein
MHSLSLPLIVILLCGGCAGIESRDLTSSEILALAVAEIRECCRPATSDRNLMVKRTEEGWLVAAPSSCMDTRDDRPPLIGLPPNKDQEAAVAEIEQTTILCAGGDVQLSYDAQGRLIGKFIGQ